MDTKVITGHVPILLARRIDDFAASLQRSRNWIMITALSEWVARQDGDAAAPADPAAFAANSLKALRENTVLGEISWQALRDAGRS